MRDPQEQIVIRDYLQRKRWSYIGGAVIHLSMMIAACFSDFSALLGILGGSAMFLSFELMRGGGSAAARTLLSMPITKRQLARSWRFVGMELPIILYLVVLLVGCGLGLLFGGDNMTAERFVIIALLQTGMLGTLFFALTGMQTFPNASVGIAQRARDIFFGLLWGASIPALMFLMTMARTRFEDLGPGHILAGIFLLGASVMGWLSAETLVARRVARGGAGRKKSPSRDTRPGSLAMPWRGGGGLSYFVRRFGLNLGGIFFIMIIVMWVMFEFFMQMNSRINRVGGAAYGQMSMFIAIIAMISIFQVIPSLRLLRTLPLRLSTITHCLVFWPLALTAFLSLLAYFTHSSFTGGAFDWNSYIGSLASCALILLGLPLILRFGMNIKSLIPVCLLLGISQSMTMVGSQKINLVALSIPIAGGIVFAIAIVWLLTYRVLRTPHPWRPNLLKSFLMQRRM